MVDHATAQYLNDNVGSVLAKALAEMSIAQPTDGVDYLSRWLASYAEQEEAKIVKAKEEQLLVEERAKMQAKLDEANAKKKEQSAVVEAKESKYKNFISKMENAETTFDDSCWTELLDVAQTTTGAQAAYLGLVDEEGIDGIEGKCIYYTHTSASSTAMNFFTAPDDALKILTQDKGVTWNALVENPGEEVTHLWRPPKVEPVVPEGEAAEGEADPAAQAPAMPYLPVSVPCVTDVEPDVENSKPGVHYFEMTRLGAYVAVPLVYTTYYGADALADATTYEEEKKKRTIEDAEAADVAAKAEEAAAQAGTDAPEGEAPPELVIREDTPLELRGTAVKLVLCMDTLGTNTAIDEAKIPDLLELCKAVQKCKEATEKRQVDQQARASLQKSLEARELEVLQGVEGNAKLAETEQMAEEEKTKKQNFKGEANRVLAEEQARQQLEEEIPQCRTEVDAALQERESEETSAAEEEQKELVQKKFAYLKARDVVIAQKALITKLKSWVVMSPDVLNVLAATAFMYGYPKDSLYPKKKPILKWDKLQTVLDDKFFDVISKADLTEIRKDLQAEQKLTAVLAMASPAGFDEAKAKEVAPAIELLFIMIQAACAYRKAHLDVSRAAYEKRKADAAAEEGATFDEKPLEELDDDYVEG